MRRTALVSMLGVAFTSAAVAADLPPRPSYKAPPAYVAYNWTGFYIGGHIGYGWSRLRGTDPTDGSTSEGTLRGFLGGGQLGYNYQIGSIVLGIEGDFSWADVKRTDSTDSFGLTTLTTTSKNDYFATVAGRIGYAFDRWLPYFKGGGAWTRDKLEASAPPDTLDAHFDRTGWMVGGGLEWAFLDNWSAKLEYNYLSFAGIDEHAVGTGTLTADATNVSMRAHLLKLGVNYKFF